MPAVLTVAALTAALAGPPAGPPTAPARPVTFTLHGEPRVDPWAWLRTPSPATRRHLRAEAAWTEASTAHLATLREALLAEAIARHPPAVVLEARPFGDVTWRTVVHPGDAHEVIERCDAAGCVPVLDLGREASRHRWFSLAEWAPAGEQLAWTVDTDGSERHTLFLRDLVTGRQERVPGVAWGIAWSADARHVFYVVLDDAWRPWQVRRHALGTPPQRDAVVWEERDERFHVDLHAQGGHLWVRSESATTTELRALDLARPEDPLEVVWPRADGVLAEGGVLGTDWVVWTQDATSASVRARPIAAHAPWRDLRPPDPALEGITVVDDALVLHLRTDGLEHLAVWRGGAERPIPLELGAAWDLERVPQGEGPIFALAASSWLTHRHLLGIDTRTGQVRPLAPRPPPPAPPGEHLLSRRTVRARDGVPIPVTVLRHRDTPEDGTAPLFLTAYGAYGATWGLEYEDLYLSMADRGVILARAHVRGGGDLGRAWHLAGRMDTKRRSFEDTLDVARALRDGGVVAPTRMALYGLSAGGALVGAVINAEPGLFSVAVAEVPFVDVLTTMSDETLPLTVTEWEEWGNPADPEPYRWMRAWSPYDNIVAADYPAVLATAALHDSAVGYWEPAKWVQRLRALRTDVDPTLLDVDLHGGHAGTPGRFGYAQDQARTMAWVLDALGVDR